MNAFYIHHLLLLNDTLKKTWVEFPSYFIITYFPRHMYPDFKEPSSSRTSPLVEIVLLHEGPSFWLTIGLPSGVAGDVSIGSYGTK